MVKFNRTFTLKCDDVFRLKLHHVARTHKMSSSKVLRLIVDIAYSEIK